MKQAIKTAPKGPSSDHEVLELEDSMLESFFVGEIKDIYWAEKHLVKVIPKMQKAATSQDLQKAFSDHLQATEKHVTRLEQVFKKLGQKAEAKKCDAIAGITKEGEEIIDDTKKGTATRDVGLIMAGQKVEHYEISTYGSLVQLARTLGHHEVAEILETTLRDEKEADKLLTSVAEKGVNSQASHEQN
jgi:ferritin-like metal-binding protein YciE